jgi:hypothetical protein
MAGPYGASSTPSGFALEHQYLTTKAWVYMKNIYLPLKLGKGLQSGKTIARASLIRLEYIYKDLGSGCCFTAAHSEADCRLGARAGRQRGRQNATTVGNVQIAKRLAMLEPLRLRTRSWRRQNGSRRSGSHWSWRMFFFISRCRRTRYW